MSFFFLVLLLLLWAVALAMCDLLDVAFACFAVAVSPPFPWSLGVGYSDIVRDTDVRLDTVAMTRPKRSLTVIGDSETVLR